MIQQANDLFASGEEREAFAVRRRLSIKQTGKLLLGVPDRFAALKSALPEMPSEKVQHDWNGSSDRHLLRQSCAFVRSIEAGFVRLCGRPLEGATILDYGCGRGRLMRLMYRFSDPERIYGTDPWDAAIDICRTTRVLGHVAQCDYVPRELPFDGVRFVVYAFSVFTHLSERTAGTVLGAIRRRIDEKGLLALTVRPVEYWRVQARFDPATDATEMRARHPKEGFRSSPTLASPSTARSPSVTHPSRSTTYDGTGPNGTLPLTSETGAITGRSCSSCDPVDVGAADLNEPG